MRAVVSRGAIVRSSGLAALYAALLGGLGVAAWSAGGDVGVLAGAAMVVVAAAPTAVRLRSDPLDAPGVYAAASGVFYGPLSLTWTGSPPAIPAPAVDRVDVAQGLVLVAASLVVFGLGARLAGPAQRRPAIDFCGPQQPPIAALIALLAVGMLGLVAGLALGAIGYNADAGAASGVLPYSQAFQQFSLLGAFTVLALAFWVFRWGDRRLVWLLIAMIGAQALAGFASGYKQNALLPILFTGAAFVACTGRIPWRAAGVAFVLAVLVLLPASILYRGVLRPNPNPSARVVTTPGGLAREAAEYVSIRFRLIDHVALIRSRTPGTFPYASGRRYSLLPALILLPRVVWSDKPILDDGLEFSHSYWQIPPNVKTSTPLTQPGDLFRNFGVPGVLAGMAAWGLLVGLFGRWCRRRRSPRVEMVYIVALLTTVAFVESDLPQLLTGASRTVLVAAAVAWLVLPGRGGSTGIATVRRRLAHHPTRRMGVDPAALGHGGQD